MEGENITRADGCVASKQGGVAGQRMSEGRGQGGEKEVTVVERDNSYMLHDTSYLSFGVAHMADADYAYSDFIC